MRRNIEKFWISLRYAFRVHKPLLTFRLINTVIKAYFVKFKPLRYVEFSLGYTCNLKCQHCFAVALEDKKRKKLSVEDYRRIAKECMALGTVNFSFQGGEPLLYPELGEIINVCEPSKNVISITTNGSLLTREKIKELKNYKVDILTVSLDSAIPEEHDYFRGGKDIFNKALQGIKEAIMQGIHVTIGATLHHKNIKSEGILKLCNLAVKLKCVLCFTLAVPIGNWANQKEILLTTEDLLYLNYLIKKSVYIRTDFEANLAGYGCGAVKEILYITPYGDVLPCSFLHLSLGDARKESINNIHKRALKNPYFNVYYKSCLCATDKEFREKYLSKIVNSNKYPMPFNEL